MESTRTNTSHMIVVHSRVAYILLYIIVHSSHLSQFYVDFLYILLSIVFFSHHSKEDYWAILQSFAKDRAQC